MDIEIFSDVVCPWCYIGKRRLDKAIAAFDGEVTIRYRAFQLDPSTPHECQPLADYLTQRFGEAARMTGHVTQVAAADGLTLNFDRAVMNNTLDAHRLLWFAGNERAVVFGGTADTQEQLAEVLHRLHFADGADIGDLDVLTAAAVEVGLDSVRVRQLLASTEGSTEVQADLNDARRVGVGSVPTFVFAGKYAVSGAQAPESLLDVLNEVRRRESAHELIG